MSHSLTETLIYQITLLYQEYGFYAFPIFLTFQLGHTYMGPRFKVSSERPEVGEQSCDPWIGSLACYLLHHCHTSFYSE